MHKWFTIQNQKGIIMKNRFILFQRSGVYYLAEFGGARQEIGFYLKFRSSMIKTCLIQTEAI